MSQGNSVISLVINEMPRWLKEEKIMHRGKTEKNRAKIMNKNIVSGSKIVVLSKNEIDNNGK